MFDWPIIRRIVCQVSTVSKLPVTMTYNTRTIILIVGIVLAAFAIGVIVGDRPPARIDSPKAQCAEVHSPKCPPPNLRDHMQTPEANNNKGIQPHKKLAPQEAPRPTLPWWLRTNQHYDA